MTIYIIVLGGPEIWLMSRLDESVCLYRELSKKYTDIKMILSGRGTHENAKEHPESQTMYNYLKTYVPESILIQESESKNTYENSVCSYKLLQQMKFDPSKDMIYIVTSDFHMDRAAYIFTKIKQISELIVTKNQTLNIKFRKSYTLIKNADDHRKILEHEVKAIKYLRDKYEK